MRFSLISCIALLLSTVPSSGLIAQTAADSAAIRGAALDYIEGWFDGDPDRMARSLHPELIKRIVVSDDVTEREWIDGMGVTKLVGGTRRGFGREIPEEDRRTDMTIFDITGRASTVKLDAGPWVDYMHLVRVDGEWKILNVLWEMK